MKTESLKKLKHWKEVTYFRRPYITQDLRMTLISTRAQSCKR